MTGKGVGRRRVLTAIGAAASAAVAGCSDSGTQTQNSPTATGTEAETGTTPSTSGGSTTDSAETTSDQGNLETDEPASEEGSNGIEPYMNENDMIWVEVENVSENISLPTDAYGAEYPESYSEEGINTYDDFVLAAGSSHPNTDVEGPEGNFELDTVYIYLSHT